MKISSPISFYFLLNVASRKSQITYMVHIIFLLNSTNTEGISLDLTIRLQEM